MLNCVIFCLISFIQLLTSNNDIELLFAGDAMQHGPQIVNAHKGKDNYQYDNYFTYIKSDISAADFAIANLECPLAGKPYSGYPAFSAPIQFALALKNAGFDLLTTSNNHALDKGEKGVISTIQSLNKLKIPHVGTYRDSSDRDTISPFLITLKGIKFAFLSYTYGTNSEGEYKCIVDRISHKKIIADIQKARSANAQIICVMLHWGIEYQLLPSNAQHELNNFLRKQGVDLIIGSHPHVIQPFELTPDSTYHKNILTVYSLGNFISNQTDTNSRGGAIIKVHISKYGNLPIVKDASYQLVFVQKPCHQANYYQLIPTKFRNLILPHSKKQFDSFVFNNTKNLTKYNINVQQEE